MFICLSDSYDIRYKPPKERKKDEFVWFSWGTSWPQATVFQKNKKKNNNKSFYTAQVSLKFSTSFTKNIWKRTLT